MFLSKIVPIAPPKVLLSSPSDVLKNLPGMAAKPITHAPFPIQKVVLGKLLLKMFEESLKEGDMDFLQGHWLEIEISDIGLSLQFSCGPKRDVEIRKSGCSDACIRGNLKSFVYLAARKEDPDTLFFQRDLVIEGDTNIGLEVKNLMDGLDLDLLPKELVFGIRCGAEYMDAFC